MQIPNSVMANGFVHRFVDELSFQTVLVDARRNINMFTQLNKPLINV